GWPPLYIDFLHYLRVGIFRQIQFCKTRQGFVVFRKKEIVILLLLPIIKGNGHRIVIGEIARLKGPNENLYIRRNTVKSTHLPFNDLCNIRGSGLSGAAQANKDEDNEGTSQKRH